MKQKIVVRVHARQPISHAMPAVVTGASRSYKAEDGVRLPGGQARFLAQKQSRRPIIGRRRRATGRSDYLLNSSVPQQLQGRFRKAVFVGASPTRGSFFHAGRKH